MHKDNTRKNLLKLYTTIDHNCSYLIEKEASTVVVDPNMTIDKHTLTFLTEQGFWRNGYYFFSKPDCQHCEACIPIRIPLNHYQMSVNEKRCLRKNRDLDIIVAQKPDNSQLYTLYKKYINSRHVAGDMYPANRKQYDDFLKNYIDKNKLVSFFLDDELVCVSVMDELTNAYMAIYTFFDPDYTKRSLGHFAILWQITYAQVQMKNYLYLGYWIKQCRKMAYKNRYKPCQIRVNGQWKELI